MIERVSFGRANLWVVVVSEEGPILGALVMIAVLMKIDVWFRRPFIGIAVLKNLLHDEERAIPENKPNGFGVRRDAFKDFP